MKIAAAAGKKEADAAAPQSTGEVERLEASLMDAVDDDQRLSSGTRQDDGSSNVLNFVQMTGLTTKRADAIEMEDFAVVDETAAQAIPISFFERGVEDVDASLDPLVEVSEDVEINRHDFSAVDEADEQQSESVSGLNEILSELADPSTYASQSILAEMPEAMESAVVARPEPQTFEDPPPGETGPAPIAPDMMDDPAAYETAPVEEVRGRENDTGIIEPAREEENAAPPSSTLDLEAAKDLLRELDSRALAIRTPEVVAAPQVHPSLVDIGNGLAPVAQAYDDDAEVDYARRSQNRHRRHHRRRMARWMFRISAVLLVGGGLSLAAWFFIKQTETPRAAYDGAVGLLDQGKYAQASSEFLTFSRRFPTHPLHAEAMFMAGYALQLTTSSSAENTARARDESLKLLDRFVTENPGHPKVARAETFIGVLYYRTGRYQDAVNVLGDPDRRLLDPGAYLTTLRTLGRSYGALSEVSPAHTSFMRAASLTDNMTPEQDYVELAGLYQDLADRSASESDRQRYLAAAIEQWDHAIQVPDLLKNRREEIQLMRDVIASRLARDFGDRAGVAEPSEESGLPDASITEGE